MTERKTLGEPVFEGFGGESDALERTILASPLLGGGLPAEARAHLDQAAERYHLTDVAETHLHEAAALAPDHAAVLIAFYRFYFYKGRLAQALQIAQACLEKAMRLVVSIGTFLQQFYIYGVEFLESGNRVGMKRRELDPMDVGDEDDDELPSALPRAATAGGVR